MGILARAWHSIYNNFISNDFARKRADILSVSNDFIRSAKCLTCGPEAPEGTYTIMAGSKDMVGNFQHGFIRFINPKGDVECDIHGLRDHKGNLEAFVEPRNIEYFNQLKDRESTILWQGSASEAGAKMQKAMAFVENLNGQNRRYNIVSNNCNTLLRSLIEVMDIPVPQDLPRWNLGYGTVLQEDISASRKHFANAAAPNPVAWLGNFLKGLAQEKIAIRDVILNKEPRAAMA
jgi:hypothetical protein